MNIPLSNSSLTAAVRTRGGEDLGAMSLEDFAAKLREEVDSKVIL